MASSSRFAKRGGREQWLVGPSKGGRRNKCRAELSEGIGIEQWQVGLAKSEGREKWLVWN